MALFLPPGFQLLMGSEAAPGCGIELLIRNEKAHVIAPGQTYEFLKENENGLLQYIIISVDNPLAILTITTGFKQSITLSFADLFSQGFDEPIAGHWYYTLWDIPGSRYTAVFTNPMLENYVGELTVTVKNPTPAPITMLFAESKRWRTKNLPE